MLANSSSTAAGRIRFLLIVFALACGIPIAIYVADRYEMLHWPNASNPVCILLGVLAGAFILFEMMLWPRKQMTRGRRWIPFPTRWWTKWHVWIGILSLPAAVLHSGFSLGGALSASFMILFVLTILSGVWGTVLQQWLPAKLLKEFPQETIVAGMDIVARANGRDIDGIIHTIVGDAENAFFKVDLKDYIVEGTVPAKSGLESAAQSGLLFEQLRRAYASDRTGRDEAERMRKFQRKDVNRRLDLLASKEAATKPEEQKILAAIDRLEELADERRNWGRQKRIHFWLHSWLVLHVPLSFAVLILLFVHTFYAFKKWGW